MLYDINNYALVEIIRFHRIQLIIHREAWNRIGHEYPLILQ